MACIPTGIGLIGSLLGKGKGKETEYTAQAPEYQQQFSEDFMRFLQSKLGQGATPYGGQVAASAQNPFTQSAFGLWGASPYGQFSGPQPGMGQPQMPPQGSLGGGQAPGRTPMTLQGIMGQPQAGQLKESRRPMQRPMPQQGGLGGPRQMPQRRGVPFQR